MNTQQRSEGLLPAGEDDEPLEVAEEVSLDLQADSTRRVGAPPPDTPVGKPAEALAASLQPATKADVQADNAALEQAIERAVPPSV